jgi:hypothetical protein
MDRERKWGFGLGGDEPPDEPVPASDEPQVVEPEPEKPKKPAAKAKKADKAKRVNDGTMLIEYPNGSRDRMTEKMVNELLARGRRIKIIRG